MYKEIEGFIYKAAAFDQNNQMYLKLYCRAKDSSFQVLINNEQSYYFKLTHNATEWKTLDGYYAEKFYCQSLKARNILKEQLQKEHIRSYEFDVKPVERFLMDNNIYGSIKVNGDYKIENGSSVFLNPKIIPSEFFPEFDAFSFDIETSKDGRIISIASYCTGLKRVLILASPEIVNSEIDTLYIPSEADLIKQFFLDLKTINPEIIIGWNVVGFDLKYIFDRCEKLKIKFDLSADQFETRMYQSMKGDWIIDIPGRVVIDGPWSLKMNFFSYESFKLNEVARIELNEAKDIDEDEVLDKWGEIERRYREDKLSLAKYNLKDAELVLRIFDKTKLINLLVNRSIISGMLLERVGGSTASFDHFFLPALHRFGYVAQNVLDVEWSTQASGGFVLSPEVGIHKNIIVLDFKSLYPTVIRTFFIDPLSRIDNAINPIQTPIGVPFSKTKHILPNKISELLEKRATAKKNKNDNLSMAIKILMNSFYGVLGSSGCRFYHPDLPEAITGSGQWVLKITIEYLENLGYRILYGDTDSIFVLLNKEELAIKTGQDLVTKVNSFLSHKIRNEFQLDSHLEIQFDKSFSQLLLMSTRSNKEGAKKRYAGLISKNGVNDTPDELVLTGMEFVRSDWSRLAKQFQYELVLRIFKEQSVEEFISETIKKLENGEFNSDLVLSKRLSKPIEEYTKNVPPHVKALRLLFEKLKIRKKKAEFVMTLRGPVPIELEHSDIDYNYYIEKQLSPVAQSVLPLIGLDFNQLRNKQLSLF